MNQVKIMPPMKPQKESFSKLMDAQPIRSMFSPFQPPTLPTTQPTSQSSRSLFQAPSITTPLSLSSFAPFPATPAPQLTINHPNLIKPSPSSVLVPTTTPVNHKRKLDDEKEAPSLSSSPQVPPKTPASSLTHSTQPAHLTPTSSTSSLFSSSGSIHNSTTSLTSLLHLNPQLPTTFSNSASTNNSFTSPNTSIIFTHPGNLTANNSSTNVNTLLTKPSSTTIPRTQQNPTLQPLPEPSPPVSKKPRLNAPAPSTEKSNLTPVLTPTPTPLHHPPNTLITSNPVTTPGPLISTLAPPIPFLPPTTVHVAPMTVPSKAPESSPYHQFRMHATKKSEKIIEDLNDLMKFLGASEPTLLSNGHLTAAQIQITQWLGLLAKAKEKSVTASSPSGTDLGFDPTKSQLSDFILLDTIGAGTFAKVKLVRHKTTGKAMVMKLLGKDKIIKLKQREHVINEKNILSACDHPFIVKLYTTMQDHTFLYLLMEFVNGGELFACVRKSGVLSNTIAKFYAAEIVLALSYLHAQNIVHRDLKPENLLLDVSGHIKLADFGFAKKVVDKTFTLCGTPEYIAPEIIMSRGHSRAVDWWSLGILIYEMLAGDPPFFNDDNHTVFEKILYTKPTYPSYFDPNAKDIIEKFLVVDPDKRLGSTQGNELEEIQSHPWFHGVDWEQIYLRKTNGPIKPRVLDESDTRNFTPVVDTNDHPVFFDEKGLFKGF